MKFKVKDRIKPATEDDAFIIGQGNYGNTTKDTIFEVLVVVEKGFDHQSKAQGLIIFPLKDKLGYPYIWNENRFVVA